MKKESIIEKVKRALVLAKDNPNDSEGQTALTLAQRLMVKHDISMSEVSIDDLHEKKPVEIKVSDHKKLAWWEKRLAGIISSNFRCYHWWNTYNRKSVITFMGLENDVELAKEIFNLSCEAVKYYSDRFVKEYDLIGNAAITRKYKDDYIKGFLVGLYEKFQEQIKENEEWGLILVKDEVIIKSYEEMTFKSERIKAPDLFSVEARTKGYKDGKEIDHTRRKLEQV